MVMLRWLYHFNFCNHEKNCVKTIFLGWNFETLPRNLYRVPRTPPAINLFPSTVLRPVDASQGTFERFSLLRCSLTEVSPEQLISPSSAAIPRTVFSLLHVQYPHSSARFMSFVPRRGLGHYSNSNPKKDSNGVYKYSSQRRRRAGERDRKTKRRDNTFEFRVKYKQCRTNARIHTCARAIAEIRAACVRRAMTKRQRCPCVDDDDSYATRSNWKIVLKCLFFDGRDEVGI